MSNKCTAFAFIPMTFQCYHYADFELTAEELQEEQEDAAIRIIQRAYRGKRAMQLLKQLIRANYVKIRDPDFENGFLYKNKTTGNVLLWIFSCSIYLIISIARLVL